MKIGFIGAGKVGFSLGKFFAEGGVPVTGYYSRRGESSLEAALFTGTKQYEKIEELVNESDAIFLTVPDAMISSVFEKIKELKITGKQICHCSGAAAAGEAFPGIEKTGAFGYSIHPLFPFSSKYDSYRELPGAFFCLEGDGPHLETWEELLKGLGAQVQIISKEAKAGYHAACAISSNLMCALVQTSLDLLVSRGFTQELALKALAPLIRSNAEHILESGPVGALTGPVERNDVPTVKKHLNSFDSRLDAELYRAASKKLIQVAEKKNPDRDYESLKKILD